MNENAKEMSEGLLRKKTAHIFYCSDELAKYVENAISYIVFGIKQGDHVLLVENTRIYPMILKELEDRLTAEEMEQLLYADNFDFYWRNNNFHPRTIMNHFTEVAGPLLESGKAVRTWGHIEWGVQEDIEREIVEYEKALDTVVHEQDAVSVCAYDASKVTDSLKTRLMAVHGLYMTDEKVHALALDRAQ
ncbi:MAG TPA: MEDS domain-containing protein [Planococcus sp. (in: firmicutes)]|nr:MEDS domain-containing protein [Planococcus sp. (in: firmicutes)]